MSTLTILVFIFKNKIFMNNEEKYYLIVYA